MEKLDAPLEMIELIREAAALNDSLSKEGMNGRYRLRTGATMDHQMNHGLQWDSLLTRVLMRTTSI
jgi:L-cysteine desulfidase